MANTCDFCDKYIPNGATYYEGDVNILCEECGEDYLMWSEDVQAYVHEYEYKDVYFDDELSDVELFKLIEKGD